MISHIGDARHYGFLLMAFVTLPAVCGQVTISSCTSTYDSSGFSSVSGSVYTVQCSIDPSQCATVVFGCPIGELPINTDSSICTAARMLGIPANTQFTVRYYGNAIVSSCTAKGFTSTAYSFLFRSYNISYSGTQTPTGFQTLAPSATSPFPTPFPTPFPSLFPTPYPSPFPTAFPTQFPTQYPTPFPGSSAFAISSCSSTYRDLFSSSGYVVGQAQAVYCFRSTCTQTVFGCPINKGLIHDDSSICAAARVAGIPVFQTFYIYYHGSTGAVDGCTANGLTTSSFFFSWSSAIYLDTTLNSPSKSNSSSSSTGATVGAVVGSLMVAAFIGGCILYACRKHQQKMRNVSGHIPPERTAMDEKKSAFASSAFAQLSNFMQRKTNQFTAANPSSPGVARRVNPVGTALPIAQPVHTPMTYAPAAVTPVGIPVGQPVHHGPTAPAFLEPVPPVPSVPPVPPAPPVPVLHAEPLPHTAYMAPPPDHDAYIQPPSAPYMHPEAHAVPMVEAYIEPEAKAYLDMDQDPN